MDNINNKKEAIIICGEDPALVKIGDTTIARIFIEEDGIAGAMKVLKGLGYNCELE